MDVDVDVDVDVDGLRWWFRWFMLFMNWERLFWVRRR